MSRLRLKARIERLGAHNAGVKVGEKLKLLTADRNRSEVARLAGVKPTILNNYINRGSEPMSSTAFRLAKFLNVPLDWLLDDNTNWPPPQAPTNTDSLATASNEALMLEVARRYRIEMLDVRQRIAEVEAHGIGNVRGLISEHVAGDPLPKPVLDAMMLWALMTQVLKRWSVDVFAQERHAQLPGREFPEAEISLQGLLDRYDAWYGVDGIFMAVTKLLLASGEEARKLVSQTRHRDKPLAEEDVAAPKIKTPRRELTAEELAETNAAIEAASKKRRRETAKRK